MDLIKSIELNQEGKEIFKFVEVIADKYDFDGNSIVEVSVKKDKGKVKQFHLSINRS